MTNCSSCGVENSAGRKFCGGCGAGLTRLCAACGTANEPSVRFCGECGQPLGSDQAAATAPGAVAAIAAAAPVAERRLVTVLFADLVGFTALSEGRDAEETRDLLSRYFELALFQAEGSIGELAFPAGERTEISGNWDSKHFRFSDHQKRGGVNRSKRTGR